MVKGGGNGTTLVVKMGAATIRLQLCHTEHRITIVSSGPDAPNMKIVFVSHLTNSSASASNLETTKFIERCVARRSVLTFAFWRGASFFVQVQQMYNKTNNNSQYNC
jgi:hypothetical protein